MLPLHLASHPNVKSISAFMTWELSPPQTSTSCHGIHFLAPEFCFLKLQVVPLIDPLPGPISVSASIHVIASYIPDSHGGTCLSGASSPLIWLHLFQYNTTKISSSVLQYYILFLPQIPVLNVCNFAKWSPILQISSIQC